MIYVFEKISKSEGTKLHFSLETLKNECFSDVSLILTSHQKILW